MAWSKPAARCRESNEVTARQVVGCGAPGVAFTGTEGPPVPPLRFPKTIRLDSSDLHVFERAAEPGEWAVPGGFDFVGIDAAQLAGKARQAFGSGWLGLGSLGRSTLVEVADIDAAEYQAVIARLAALFVERYGAPDVLAAAAAARDEAAYAATLCEHRVHTLLAIEREPSADGMVERFRVIRPARAEDHARIWTIVED